MPITGAMRPADNARDGARSEDATPVASIVICAYGKRDYTERCLETLERALGPKLGDSFELILVDNASPDDTLELFERWSNRARVLALTQNHNFSGGNNRGAASAGGEVLVFLNNDTEVPRGALEKLVDEARDPEVGVVGARLLYPSGRIQHAGVVFRNISAGTALPLHLFHHAPGDLPQARACYDLDATTGACLGIRRALFDELGGFDEAYVNGLEDIDLCLRARLKGKRVVYRGDVAIVHRERVTRGAKHDEARNAGVFVGRWGDVCGDDSETVERLFGASFTPHRNVIAVAQPLPDGAPVVFTGELDSLSPEAAEGRAMLWLAEGFRLEPALRDAPPAFTNIRPAFDDETAARLEETRRRAARPMATEIHFPGGAIWTAPPGSALIRAGCVPRRGLRDHQTLLVPSHALRERLVSDGLAPERVEVVRSAIVPTGVTPGGAGVLALVSAHEHEPTLRLLAALAEISTGVTLLPSVRTAWLDRVVGAVLPDADILHPITDESAYALLAGRFDVVVAATDADVFERRALVAAATGAAVVTRTGGPAAEVLSEGLDVAPSLPSDELLVALEAARCAKVSRSDRAARVEAAHSPAALGPRLVGLLGTDPEISLADVELSERPASEEELAPAQAVRQFAALR